MNNFEPNSFVNLPILAKSKAVPYTYFLNIKQFCRYVDSLGALWGLIALQVWVAVDSGEYLFANDGLLLIGSSALNISEIWAKIQ